MSAVRTSRDDDGYERYSEPGIHCSGRKMELTTLRRTRQRVNHLVTMSPLKGTRENDLPLAFPVRLERKIQDGGKCGEGGYPLARLGTAVSFTQISV
jgi:hypothetical protein